MLTTLRFLPILSFCALALFNSPAKADEIPVGEPIVATTVLCDTVEQAREVLAVNVKDGLAAMIEFLKKSPMTKTHEPECAIGSYNFVALNTIGKSEGIDRGHPERETAYIVHVKGVTNDLEGYIVSFAPTAGFEPGTESQSFKTKISPHNPLIRI